MYLTWLDNNSWLIELSGKRILLDPWLIGDLTFGNLTWLFRGSRSCDRAIPENLDLILLSQGIEDHAHPETLKHLDKSIPVVASPSAATVAQSLGFLHVTALYHGKTFTLDDQIQILATVGSLVGPTTKENGYLLTALGTNTKLYYEPHGFHDPRLKDHAPIDVVITPQIDLALPVVGSIIKGKQTSLKLAQALNPQVMIPTAAGGDITFEGVLMSILNVFGSPDQLRHQLAQSDLATQVIELKPGISYEVNLTSSDTSSDRSTPSVTPAALSPHQQLHP
ncbi:MBL fold metallo-hydrolase [Myxacorys almedinensis A]|uniref:MBL fold metallo-hydrolase n=2 Tax=Myxacorys TaxID=2056239 RepID=A0A8J8CL83_9CYAN|nr:MBL fold metallo-hydrolase [Myxacorys almedinensis]NDJ17480.1 MBL fold metallo-hydrolase [Myxacorys almedinensis A]